MIYFLDSSVLVKRYCAEPGSTTVRGLFRRQREIAVARITYAEVASAIARQAREGLLTIPTRDAIVERLRRDLDALTVVEVRPALVERAGGLVLAWPLRAYDAVQLAAALTLQTAGLTVDFWCSDRRLLEAAAGSGLRATLVR